MEAKIVKKGSKSITLEIEIPISGSMLATEEYIQKAVNLAGLEATSYATSQFDSDGTPILVKGLKYTSKGKVAKAYQSPYGEFVIERHVYQNTQGGATFCPMDQDARIIVGSTPKFAKIVSSKYSDLGSSRVQSDLYENHGRYISRSFIQDISEAVGKTIAEKQDKWEYTVPVSAEDVAIIGISLDGTCMLMIDDGYRQAMVGTISLYNKASERLYTHYTSSAPELGKSVFYREFDADIKTILKLYPNIEVVGVADGAKDNWTFLGQYTQNQVLDFFHATEYLALAAEKGFKRKWEGKEWLKEACHKLKHEEAGAKDLLNEIKGFHKRKITQEKKDKIESAITYFTNHNHQMNYKAYQEKNYPIGSGVVEAACKVIIKQRLCNSGMKWSDEGAKSILCLRCFNYSDGKWSQFWDKLNRYGK